MILSTEMQDTIEELTGVSVQALHYNDEEISFKQNGIWRDMEMKTFSDINRRFKISKQPDKKQNFYYISRGSEAFDLMILINDFSNAIIEI